MSDKKDSLVNIIIKAKDDIENFKSNIMDKKDELPDINELKRELTKINKVIDNLKILCDTEEKSLNKYVVDINYEQFKELATKIDILQEVILTNLPKGMDFDERKEVLNEGVIKKLFLKYGDDKIIGDIIIKEETGNLILGVKIEDKDYFYFTIENPLKIYRIISYINYKFNLFRRIPLQHICNFISQIILFPIIE